MRQRRRLLMKKSVTKEGESTDKYAILEFDADGKAVYNGTLGEGYEDMHEESTYKLGNDWREEGRELSGHVYFKIWGGPYDGNDRFECVFKNDEMYLVREIYPVVLCQVGIDGRYKGCKRIIPTSEREWRRGIYFQCR